MFSDLTDFDLFIIGEVAIVTDNINTIILKAAFTDAYTEGHLQKYCSLIGCNATEIVSSLSNPALIFHFMLRQALIMLVRFTFYSYVLFLIQDEPPLPKFWKPYV